MCACIEIESSFVFQSQLSTSVLPRYIPDLALFSILRCLQKNNSNPTPSVKIGIMGFTRPPKVTAEGATKELPLETGWELPGMPQSETNDPDPEYAQETHCADDLSEEELEADIKLVHERVLTKLIAEDMAFLKQFTTLIGNEEEAMQFDSKGVYLPLATGRTILHRIISSVSEGNLRPDIATLFTEKIVHDEPGLLLERSSLDSDLNALELAVSSQNCLGIIQAICEHGMLGEIESPNDKKGIDVEEEELHSASIQGQKLVLSGFTGVISQEQIFPAMDCASGSKATIKKNGKIFSVDVEWHELTQDGKETFLHKAIQKNRNDYALYLLDKMHDLNEHKHVLLHKGQSGLTPLHHAVYYDHCNSERVKLVEKMIHLCPEALAMDSAALSPNSQSIVQDQTAKGVQKNYAPYKYFLELEATAQKPSTPAIQPKAPRTRTIASRQNSGMQSKMRASFQHSKELNSQAAIGDMHRLLRLGCMQYHGGNRETLTNLIGKPVGSMNCLLKIYSSSKLIMSIG
jgi:hypothetical protein